MLPRVIAPNSGVQHLEQNCKININSSDRGNGTLYISEERLIWENVEHRGLSLGYKEIAIHAISKDLQNFPEECLYVMYNGDVSESPPEGAVNGNGQAEHSDSDSGDEDPNGTISEIRFVPECKENLKRMFDAMSDCQCLHPDSEDSDDYYEGHLGNGEGNEGADYPPMVYEDGGAGEGFYTSEEGLEHLTAQGQATLARLENMLAQSQISPPPLQEGIAQMGGVLIEDEEDRPRPDDPPVVGRSTDNNEEKMDDSDPQGAVEGQFDDVE